MLAACIMAVSVIWHSSYIKTLRFHAQHAQQLGSLLAPQEAADACSNPSVYTVSTPLLCMAVTKLTRPSAEGQHLVESCMVINPSDVDSLQLQAGHQP